MDSLVATLLRKRLWLLFVSFFLWMAAITLLLPHMTPISVNYFASRAAGVPVSCEASDKAIVQAACAVGSATAVRYVSITSFLSNAILGLLVSPLAGWLSDSYGRKPFFLVALALSSLPYAWVAAFLHMNGSIGFTFYYFFDVLKGIIVPMSLVTAATADVAAPEWRATLFSLLAAETSVAFLVGSALGGMLSAAAAATATAALCLVNLVITSLFMKETVSEEAMETARFEHRQSSTVTVTGAAQSVMRGLRDTFAVLTRSQLFFRLAIVTMASGFVMECLQDLVFNYLMISMGFGASENSRILILLGLLGLPVQGLLLPALLKVISQKWVLVLANSAMTLQMISLAVAPSLGPWAVYASMVVGAPGSMAMPVISALKSVHAGEAEQGKVQGALYAAKGLAQGLGPLMFSALFTYFTQKSHFFPEAPILGLAVVMGFGVIVACTVTVPPITEHTDSDSLHEQKEEVIGNRNRSERTSLESREAVLNAAQVDLASQPLLDPTDSL